MADGGSFFDNCRAQPEIKFDSCAPLRRPRITDHRAEATLSRVPEPGSTLYPSFGATRCEERMSNRNMVKRIANH
jgi:hypothetical protein